MNAYIWLALLVVFLLAEAACPIHLVSIWFALGALVAILASLMDAALWVQVLLFLVVSGGLLASLWPLTRKYFTPELAKTNLDSILGTTGFVTADIDNNRATGEVKLGAVTWTARSTSDSQIPAGTLVQVDRIEGVKVFVTPVEVPANK